MSQALANENKTSSIWSELEAWALDFEPWEKFVLANAVRSGRLSEEEIHQAYALFLRDYNLSGPDTTQIKEPKTITGRDASENSSANLKAIHSLKGINAIPANSRLEFGNHLTVIYGGNGVGKSGFVRVLGNACFSRGPSPIIGNIYEDQFIAPYADAELEIGQSLKPVTDILNTSNSSLKNFTVFDTAVSKAHISAENPLSFKPVGFDVFEEMARVYGLISKRLSDEVSTKQKPNEFLASFVDDSAVTEHIKSLSPATDIEALKKLASYGEAEETKLKEIDKEILGLQKQSTAETVKELDRIKADLNAFLPKLSTAIKSLDEQKTIEYKNKILEFKEKSKQTQAIGLREFQVQGLSSTGSQEWLDFIRSAHNLAKEENSTYPHEADLCLLCQQSLSDASVKLLQRYWLFLLGDSQVSLQAVSDELDIMIGDLANLDLEIFKDDSKAKAQLEKVAPEVAHRIGEVVLLMKKNRDSLRTALEAMDSEFKIDEIYDPIDILRSVIQDLEGKQTELKKIDSETKIKELTKEKTTLLHRRILNQLIQKVEQYVTDLSWVTAANDKPKKALSPRKITAKESDLFQTLIKGAYEKRLSEECAELNCALPIQLKSRGDKGQTLRSLVLPKGHKPDDILSEGEQKALSLADFLTEVSLNPTSAGIILDDPVNSLDNSRKEKIACRLAKEATNRQTIIFTHDMVFLTKLIEQAEKLNVHLTTHWIQHDKDHKPGQLSLNDCPSNTSAYRTTKKAKDTLIEAKTKQGSEQEMLIMRGMGELRRTLEEAVIVNLFKGVVKRWEERIYIGSLTKINWSDELAQRFDDIYGELSRYIEGHSHSEEKNEGPVQLTHLEAMISKMDTLIKDAKPDKTVISKAA